MTALAAAAMTLGVAGAAKAQVPLHLEDAAYLLQMTSAASAQLEIGRLAAEKATDPNVRAFAAEIVGSYTGRLERLTALGEPYGIPAMTQLEPWSQWRLDQLKTLDGAEFDATYVAGEEPAHNAEEWVSVRASRHATREPIRREAEALIAPTHREWKQALRLTVKHEAELPAGRLHPDDASMLLFAMNVDMAQQALGQLALEKASSQRVKAFAQRMIDEHGQSLEMLKTLAQDRDLTPIAAPGPLEVLVLTQLQSLDGPAFDAAYMEGQVIFHDNWYKRIEYTAHNGKDEAVKGYAMAAHRLGMNHHDAVYAIMTTGDDAAHHHATPSE